VKLKGKRIYKTAVIIISIIVIVISVLYISMALIEPLAHISPDYPRSDIVPILSKVQLTEADYKTIFHQTGLGRPAIDELRTLYTDSTDRILQFQKNFFSDVSYICEKNSPISREESVVNKKGELIDGTQLAPLHNGDILITKSSHTFGWRNGHAAIIIDAAGGKTLESVVLGTDSMVQDISKWTNYPNFMLLRLKDAPRELTDKIAKNASEILVGIPYDFTVGVFNPKLKDRNSITGTQCSHLVWEAYALYGYDLDFDAGKIVTPQDLAKSPLLEVVQVYGTDTDNIWP
jgi:uncharacterized protein YycO